MTSRKKLFHQFILALSVFVFAQIILAVILSFLGSSYFNPNNWSRWDSGHYLRIASDGYEFFPCAGKFGYPKNATEMCGNTGWFPGYPFLIRLFSLFFKNTVTLGGLLSKIFYFLSLLLVVMISGVEKFSFRSFVFVCCAAFCSGFIYYNAIFPMSAVLFLELMAIISFMKRKWYWSGIFCFLASFFYPTGFLLSIALALTTLIRMQSGVKEKFSRIFILLFMGAMGIIAAFLIFQFEVGDWLAFIKVQAKYGHGFHNPLANIAAMLSKLPLHSFSLNDFINLQSAIVIMGYLVLSVFFFLKKMYRVELYLLTYLYVTLYILFPWMVGGNLSMYRAESLLLPFVFVLKEMSVKWTLLALAVLLAVGIPMAYLFFTNVLI